MAWIWMTEHRQTKCRLRNERVTAQHFEWRAGRIGAALVVARDNDAAAVRLDQDLCRAKHVAGGVKADQRIADTRLLAVDRDLARRGEVVAVAQRHQAKRLPRRHDNAMPWACVIGVAVRDQRARTGPRGIDVELAQWAIKPRRRLGQNVL